MAKAKTKVEVADINDEIVESTVESTFLDETETSQAAIDYLKEPVPFYAFKDDDKYKDDITVGVNGRIFRIKRGVQVMVPRYVYNVLMRSMEQDAKTADLINSQAEAYAAEVRSMNI